MSDKKVSEGAALWHGRFDVAPADDLMAYTESLSFDQRLWRDDIMGSHAHVSMLVSVGLMSETDGASVLAALQADGVDPDAADRWAGALFDLYRATGQQSNFDSVAIDYAMRFGRSAPAWFSIPELLGRQPQERQRTLAAMSNHSIHWVCPAELDLPAVLGLQASLSTANAPWHLYWGGLQVITPEAAKVLADQFGEWCVKPVKLVFGGAEVLEKTLRVHTPPGNRDVGVFWWRLRLDALRILRLQDEFELAALDYCVNYEVSPPPWEEARCEYVAQQVGAVVEQGFDYYRPVAQGTDDDLKQSFAVAAGIDALPMSLVELHGEILGDAAQALDDLQAAELHVAHASGVLTPVRASRTWR